MSETTPIPSRSTTPPVDPPLDTVSSTENAFLRPSHPLVSDLEQEVLDEYARLLGNVNKLSAKLAELADSPTTITLDGLRQLERKTATVYTLLKASVYSILLQEQIVNEGEWRQQQHQQDGGQEYATGTMNVGEEGIYMGEGDMSYQQY
ncbi:DASH complex subunit Dad3-domain-containing protein [Aspergillus spinulosporus]